MRKTRYALCGASFRGIYHFALPLLGMNHGDGPRFDDRAELVAILDVDRNRVSTFLSKIGRQIPFYPAAELKRMLAEGRPDVLLVVSPDCTHAEYVISALKSGCDVIVEKPMVIDSGQIRAVQAAEKRTGRHVRVAFNYRYTPTHKKLKRMILEGKLGRITNVEFTYNLDTWHGSSYFYRWNRERANSGGLSIHKGCHHFDLVNWWLGDSPEWVFAFGALNYYGKNGALRPRDEHGQPLDPVEEKRRCPVFCRHYAGKNTPEDNVVTPGWDTYNLPYDMQYPADRSRYIYDEAIDIEDTYSVVARYCGGASLSYSCNFCTPWEGYILGINGTKGRVEIVHHSNPDPTGGTAPAEEQGLITFYPLFGGKEEIVIPPVAGGHGGADFAIQRDLFDQVSDESRELGLVAGSADGAISVAMGEAVWRSVVEKRPVNVQELLGGTGGESR
jgi:predicted dehydrogenase